MDDRFNGSSDVGSINNYSNLSNVFVKTFDGVAVPFIFTDMMLWVGADEVLRILHLPASSLNFLPDSEKTTLKQLQSCSDNNKWFITGLAVGLLTSRLINRGAFINEGITHDSSLPERINAFSNIFLTDVVSELRADSLMCGVSKKEDDVLALLNDNLPGIVTGAV